MATRAAFPYRLFNSGCSYPLDCLPVFLKSTLQTGPGWKMLRPAGPGHQQAKTPAICAASSRGLELGGGGVRGEGSAALLPIQFPRPTEVPPFKA